MKRILCILLAIVLQCLLWNPSVLADSDATVTFLCNPAGEREYEVAAVLSENSHAEMMQFCIEFDPNVWELLAVAAGSAFENTSGPTISDYAEGKVLVVWEALAPLEGGTLVVLRLRAKEDASGVTVIDLDRSQEVIFATGSFEMLQVHCSPIEIVLSPSASTHRADDPENPAVLTPSPELPVASPSHFETMDNGKNQGVTLDQNRLEITSGDTALLETQDTGELLWTSSNESVALVEHGVVTAVGDGSAVITAEALDGSGQATCVVLVGEQEQAGTEPVSPINEQCPEEQTETQKQEKQTGSSAEQLWLWLLPLGGILFLLAVGMLVLLLHKKNTHIKN